MASQKQIAQRMEDAISMIGQNLKRSTIVRALMVRYRISRSQAYKSVDDAQVEIDRMIDNGDIDSKADLRMTPQEVQEMLSFNLEHATMAGDVKATKAWADAIYKLKQAHEIETAQVVPVTLQGDGDSLIRQARLDKAVEDAALPEGSTLGMKKLVQQVLREELASL